MPDSYFQLSVKNQASAIDAASEASGRAPHLLEKDIWVVWALSSLFQSELGAHLVFKGGTALSKAHKVISRFSEDVDLTYDIRALAPELVRSAPSGIDAIPPSRSQQKKWSDEIRGELLPAWLRNHAHPIIQTGLEGMKNVSSRVTEDCIFIDYEPVAPASGYALPSVKLEFGARSSGVSATTVSRGYARRTGAGLSRSVGKGVCTGSGVMASPKPMSIWTGRREASRYPTKVTRIPS
jgi:Nucleotidyl transferase AbiEii toxin, Type IV TA system